MLNHRTSLLFSALAASFALTLSPANAQTSGSGAKTNADANPPSATATYKADRKSAKDADEAWERTHRASKIIGTEVRNARGEKVGTVKDLVLDDPRSGRISQVVVAVGGVLGMGDKLFAVPYDEIQTAPGQKHFVLSRSNDLAEAFDDKHWAQFANRSSGRASGDETAAAPASPRATFSAGSTQASESGSSTGGNASSSTPTAATPGAATGDSTASSSNANASPGANRDTSTSAPTTPPATYPSTSQGAASTSAPTGSSR